MNVFGEYFAHYVCTSRFPERRAELDRIYFASPLRKIVVPCEGLKCTDAKLERDLNVLWESAMRKSDAEAAKWCGPEYEQAARYTARQFAGELERIAPGTPLIQ